MLHENFKQVKLKPTSSNMAFKQGQHIASNNVGPTCWLRLNKLLQLEEAHEPHGMPQLQNNVPGWLSFISEKNHRFRLLTTFNHHKT